MNESSACQAKAFGSYIGVALAHMHFALVFTDILGPWLVYQIKISLDKTREDKHNMPKKTTTENAHSKLTNTTGVPRGVVTVDLMKGFYIQDVPLEAPKWKLPKNGPEIVLGLPK